jgi:hypothetical protein
LTPLESVDVFILMSQKHVYHVIDILEGVNHHRAQPNYKGFLIALVMFGCIAVGAGANSSEFIIGGTAPITALCTVFLSQ